MGQSETNAYWLVETRDENRSDWEVTAMRVDGSRNWTASQIVEEYDRRYLASFAAIRVTPVASPSSWNTFDRNVTIEMREV